MESCKFPSTFTIISGLLDDVDKKKKKYKILSCVTLVANKRYALTFVFSTYPKCFTCYTQNKVND